MYVFAGRRKWIRHDKYCVNGEGKRGKRAIDDVLLNGRANRGKISVRVVHETDTWIHFSSMRG